MQEEEKGSPRTIWSVSYVGSNEAGTDGQPDKSWNIMDFQTIHQLGSVRLNRFHAQIQALRDLFGRATFRNELKNLTLASSQSGQGARLRVILAAIGIQGEFGDGGGQIRFPSTDCLDR